MTIRIDATPAGEQEPRTDVHFEPHHYRDDELPPKPYAVMACNDVNVYYDKFRAGHDVNLEFGYKEITALIGPSGCGKSTLLRSLNRMNDLIPGARVDGRVVYHDQNLYDRDVDPVQVRKLIGMVFQ